MGAPEKGRRRAELTLEQVQFDANNRKTTALDTQILFTSYLVRSDAADAWLLSITSLFVFNKNRISNEDKRIRGRHHPIRTNSELAKNTLEFIKGDVARTCVVHGFNEDLLLFVCEIFVKVRE